MSGKSDWVRVGPGEFMRVASDGQIEHRRYESHRPVLEKMQEARKMSRRDARAHTTKGGGRKLGEMPPSLHQEMMEKCGSDPDLQARFWRDHPEYMTVTPGSAGLPSKKVYSFPRRSRRR